MAQEIVTNTPDKLVIASANKRLTLTKRRYDRPTKWTLDIAIKTAEGTNKIYVNYDGVEVIETWLEGA